MTWTLAPKARADLSAVWDYTDNRWGEQQADRYIADIYQAIEEMASGVRPIRHRNGLPENYVARRSGAHIIFLSKRGQDWLVVRVLHERMDIDRHLR